jgi:hypothetical protein
VASWDGSTESESHLHSQHLPGSQYYRTLDKSQCAAPPCTGAIVEVTIIISDTRPSSAPLSTKADRNEMGSALSNREREEKKERHIYIHRERERMREREEKRE